MIWTNEYITKKLNKNNSIKWLVITIKKISDLNVSERAIQIRLKENKNIKYFLI